MQPSTNTTQNFKPKCGLLSEGSRGVCARAFCVACKKPGKIPVSLELLASFRVLFVLCFCFSCAPTVFFCIKIMPFFKVDMHTHILPRSWPDLKKKYGYGGWVQMEPCGHNRAKMMIDGKVFREVEDNCYSPEVRILIFDFRAVVQSFNLVCFVPY